MGTGCQDSGDAFPRKPIEVIVPFREGGASTAAARPIERAIKEDASISPQPFAIIPMDGAGGAVGSLRVKNAKPDGYTILNLHDGIITQKYVAGGPDYGPEAFMPIAATSQSGSVVCVGPASRFESLQQLLDEAEKEAYSVRFGSNYGAPSHFVALLLASERDDLKFSFPPMAGGADRYDHLVEGRLDATMFTVSEFMLFKSRGIQAIAYLGEERHPKLPDTSTAKEQGVDLIWGITQMWWAPKGTPPDRVDKIAQILKTAIESPTVAEAYESLDVEPRFLAGEEFVKAVAEKEALIASRSLKMEPSPISAPPMTALVLAAVIICGALFIIGMIRKRPEAPQQLPVRNTAIMIAALVAFVGILVLRIVPFWLPAALFACVLGVLLAPDRKTKIAASGIALGLSIGLHIIFSYIFIIDLP